MRIFALALVGSLLIAGSVVAQNRIAVLDVVEVMNASEANKKAGKEMVKKRDAIQSKVDKMKEPLLEKERRLGERRSMMTQEQFLEEQSDLRKEINSFKFEAQEMQAGLQTEALKHRKEIADAMSDIVAEIAKEKKFDVVLPRHGLLYAVDTVNISQEVLKRLNKRLAK
ncbi:MAG: OmpH family outer membrane protein [Alphaproteobacteria bacterium]|nr:OmpH family outer membrane protein [Alphaproteobacteria bacterium]MDD9918996.1 OmpH family outer membrane protein [Alphaproteobacteria bacterium]